MGMSRSPRKSRIRSALVGANVCIVPPKHHWFGIAHSGFAGNSGVVRPHMPQSSTLVAQVDDAGAEGSRL
jgi:hypothetical protein